MSEEKKLTEEELTKIQNLEQTLYQSLVRIGGMDFDLADVAKKKEAAVADHRKYLGDMADYKVELGKKYESTKVDLRTGVLG